MFIKRLRKRTRQPREKFSRKTLTPLFVTLFCCCCCFSSSSRRRKRIFAGRLASIRLCWIFALSSTRTWMTRKRRRCRTCRLTRRKQARPIATRRILTLSPRSIPRRLVRRRCVSRSETASRRCTRKIAIRSCSVPRSPCLKSPARCAVTQSSRPGSFSRRWISLPCRYRW